MEVRGTFFLVVVSAVCLKHTEGYWNILEAALKTVPLYNQVTESVNAVVEWTGKVPENTGKALITLKSTLKSITGELDGPMLVKIIDPKLNKDEIPLNHCLSGFNVELRSKIGLVTNIEFHSGVVSFDDTKFKVYGPYEDETSGEYKILKILFQFTDLEVPYQFTAKYSRMSPNKGYINFVFKDISSLIVEVKVPSETYKITDMLSRGKCFMDVQQITSHLSETIDMSNFGYDSFVHSFVGFGLTGFSVKSLSSEPEKLQTLRENVSEAIFWMLKPLLYDHKLFCESNIFDIEAPECIAAEKCKLNVNGNEMNKETEKNDS